MIADTCLVFGEAVKALSDDGKVGGYLVRYGSETDTDASDMRDYFTSACDFDMPEGTKSSSVYYQHGLDPTLKRRKIGTAQIKTDDVGVWVEAQLNLRDDYEKAIFQMAKDGKLGWSSGTAPHLIEREAKANGANEIKAWPLGLDASLTPNPAEPRNGAITSLKAWAVENDLVEADGSTKGRTLEKHTETVIAELEDYSGRLESLKELRASQGRPLSDGAITHLDNATSALKKILERLEALQTEPAQSTDDATKADALMAKCYGTLLSTYGA